MSSRNLAAAVATYAAKRIGWLSFRDTAVIVLRGQNVKRRDHAVERLTTVALGEIFFDSTEKRAEAAEARVAALEAGINALADQIKAFYDDDTDKFTKGAYRQALYMAQHDLRALTEKGAGRG